MLYKLAEKTRYELLGCQMLKGIEKNLAQNYYQMMNAKKNKKSILRKMSWFLRPLSFTCLKIFKKLN